MQHHRTVLSNGLRIVHVPMPAMRSVAVSLFVGVGSRFELAGEAGICHLIEHMLFKGTSRRPTAADISATIDAVGGILNAGTDKEATVYSAKVAQEHLGLAVELISDMLLHSRFSPSDLAREKSVVLEELNMLADDPEDWAHVLADALLWPDQAVGREVAGTPESVPALRRRDLRRYLERYYIPNNVVVCVAGGVRLEEAERAVAQHFGGWDGEATVPPAPPARCAEGPSVRVEHMSTKQVNLCMRFPGVGRDHPDRWPLELASTVVGGGTSSRLFVQLRERLGLAYDVECATCSLSDTGSVTVYAAMDGSKVERVLDGVLREIERLGRRRIAATELARAKQYWQGRLWLGLEETQAVAAWYGAQEILYRRIVSPQEVAARVGAVTADDVLRVARFYLSPQRAKLTAVGPVSRDRLETRLACA